MALKWLERLLPTSASDEAETAERNQLNLMRAVLMLEVAQSDCQESDVETQEIEALISAQFGGEHHDGEGSVRDILTDARKEKAESAGLYEYTRLACETLSMEDRVQLVAQFWQIAYADGVIDKYEEAAIRKVSDLLYVPHSDFIRAKLSAQALR